MEKMVFQCSKELLERLPTGAYEKKPEKAHLEGLKGSFFGWTGKSFTIDRKKAVVFVNNQTRYCLLLYPVRKKEFEHLGEYLREAVRSAFINEGIKPEVTETYLKGFEECCFMKTSDRSAMDCLNLLCDYLERWFGVDEKPEQGLIQTAAAKRLSDFLTTVNGEYGYGSERLPVSLCQMMGYNPASPEKVLGRDVYQLKIKINLSRHHIWRRILIPADYSFCELHRAIQTVFDWQNYHLHEFIVPELSKIAEVSVPEGQLCTLDKKLKLADGNDPEALHFAELADCEVKLDTTVNLRDVFGENDWCLYYYDFGDCWEHIITLEKTFADSTERYPKLLEMQGQRPPEDVGGEGGFEEFLKIMGDPDHLEHDAMKEWAKRTEPKEMSVGEVNYRLRMGL